MEWVQFAEQFLAELSGGEEAKETQLRVGSGRKREKNDLRGSRTHCAGAVVL